MKYKKPVLSLAVTLSAVFSFQSLSAQKKVYFGIESETMTWINKGYHGSF